MPDSSTHYTQAQSNEGFYEALGKDSSSSPEWAMTVLFYAALHYAQAALVYLQGSSAPKSHDERRGAIRTKFQSIASDYESLYDASRRARYDCVKPAPHELKSAENLLRAIASEIAKQAPPAEYI